MILSPLLLALTPLLQDLPSPVLVESNAPAATLDGAAPVQTTHVRVMRVPRLPRAISSFGATRVGEWVYHFGGHVGRAHAHSRDNVVGDFQRFRADDPSVVEVLPSGPALQGTALVSHGDTVVRLGGVSALNAPGEKADMHSTSSVQRFDPRVGAWTDETPLPEPRSSHDAWVIGSRVFVAGGWNLRGHDEPQWHTNAWFADLSQSPLVWQRLPDLPFARRALALASLGGRPVLVGGMDENGTFVSDVLVLDEAQGAWTKGPELPIDGFGIAATALGDGFVVSGRDGRVFRLAPNATEFDVVGELAFGRIFHRLVVDDRGDLVVLGGAGDGGHLRTGERFTFDVRSDVQELSIAIPSSAHDRQAVVRHGAALVFAGGNLGRGQHAFEPDDFVADTFALALGPGTAEAWPAMPVARQSMGAVAFDARAFFIGGFGHDGEVARAHAEIFELDLAQKAWSASALALPSARTQFQIATHAGKAFVIGGANFDPRGKEETDFEFALDVLVLDPVANTLTDSGWRLPRPRRAFAAAQLGTDVYLMGGLDDAFEPVEEVDVLDLATGTWRLAPSPRSARVGGEALAHDGRIFIAGGSSNSESGRFDGNPSFEVFDPAHGWSVAADTLPFPTRQMRLFSQGRHIAFVTTHSGAERTATAWLYDPNALVVAAPLEASSPK
jgi:N-acetylneuraminic acid mutarotase